MHLTFNQDSLLTARNKLGTACTFSTMGMYLTHQDTVHLQRDNYQFYRSVHQRKDSSTQVI